MAAIVGFATYPRPTWWYTPATSAWSAPNKRPLISSTGFAICPTVTCGNHDDCLYGAGIDGLDNNVHYLSNTGVEIDGIKFYGVPMFMRDCITDRQTRNYAMIPSDTNVLITHSPAYGILDFDDDINYGSEEILAKLPELNLRAHLYGHIHAQHGIAVQNGIIYSNGAIMDAGYTELNRPNLILL